jgi:hypothetical protein
MCSIAHDVDLQNEAWVYKIISYKFQMYIPSFPVPDMKPQLINLNDSLFEPNLELPSFFYQDFIDEFMQHDNYFYT